jgi:hypothetical protein
MQRRCGWLPGRAIDVVCNVAELNRSNRSEPASGRDQIVGLKRSFAACGKIQSDEDCAMGVRGLGLLYGDLW